MSKNVDSRNHAINITDGSTTASGSVSNFLSKGYASHRANYSTDALLPHNLTPEDLYDGGLVVTSNQNTGVSFRLPTYSSIKNSSLFKKLASSDDNDYVLRFTLGNWDPDADGTTQSWTLTLPSDITIPTGQAPASGYKGIVSFQLPFDKSASTGTLYVTGLYDAATAGGGGGASNWQAVLAAGNASGGTDAEITSGDKIDFENVVQINSQTANSVVEVGYNADAQLGGIAIGSGATAPHVSSLSNLGGNIAIGLDASTGQNTDFDDTGENIMIGKNAGTTTGWFSQSVGIGSDVFANAANTGAANQNFSNVAIGQGAMSLGAMDTATLNVAIGSNALRNITTGDQNTAIGATALDDVTTGTSNTGLGNLAAAVLTTGSDNVAVGQNAAATLTTTSNNVVIGHDADLAQAADASVVAVGDAAVAGNQSVVVGQGAGAATTTGGDSVIVGYNAGNAITSGVDNVVVGHNAGQTVTTNGSNVIVGTDADAPGGNNLVAVGKGALSANQGVSVGSFAGLNLTGTGENNTLIGYNTAATLTTGTGNTIIGRQADVLAATDSQAVCIGTDSSVPDDGVTIGGLAGPTGGQGNIAIGKTALNLTSGSNNVAIGVLAMGTGTGAAATNVAIGTAALNNATTGSDNVVIGDNSGGTITTTSSNVCIGADADIEAAADAECTVVGAQASADNQSTAIGYNANASGQRAVALGYNTVSSVTGTIAIGDAASAGSTRAIAIGDGASATSFEAVAIGSGVIANANSGTFLQGLNSNVATNAVYQETDGELTKDASTRRLKNNIRPLDIDTTKLYSLKPASFEWKKIKRAGLTDFGLVAEEVAEVIPELAGYDYFRDPETQETDKEQSPTFVRYQLLSVLLLAEVQKLRAELDELKAEKSKS